MDLRQNTDQVITVGPAVAIGDGYTTVPAVTVASVTCGLKHYGTAGAALTLDASVMAPTANLSGHYDLYLLASNVSALGAWSVAFNYVTVILPFWKDGNVITQAEWDRKYLGTTGMSAIDTYNRIGEGGSSLTVVGLASAQTFNMTGDITGNLSGSVGSVAGHTAQTGDSYAQIGIAGSSLTAIQLAGTQTFAMVGNITGDLSGSVGSLTGHTAQTGDSYARIGEGGSSLTVVGLAATQTFNMTGDITGNLSGSVGSVTGHTAQTGDSFARIGAGGSSLTALVSNATLDASINVQVASALTVYDSPTFTEMTSAFTALTDGLASANTIVNAWETQSQADPTGFHVNVMEINSATALNAFTQTFNKNTAVTAFPFFMTDSTNHVAASGLTVIAMIGEDGAAFATVVGAITEMSRTGWYEVDFSADELNADTVAVEFSATGADTLAISIKTES